VAVAYRVYTRIVVYREIKFKVLLLSPLTSTFSIDQVSLPLRYFPVYISALNPCIGKF